MPTTMLTPVTRGKAQRVGASLWRRQLLPIGDITYDGRKISFTRDYLARLVQAFRDKAYDAVPFQFADADNKHSNKPEQRRGTVRDLELTEDGLDVIVEAGPDAGKYLGEYPDLGVSASIVEAHERADGRFFPVALRHVLGTLDPRLTGMRQWEPVPEGGPAFSSGLWQCVDFSSDDGEVIDLTSYQYASPEDDAGEEPAEPAAATPETKETGMAFTADQEARLAKLLALPDEQFDALLTPPAADEGTEGDENEDGTEGEPQLTDAELQALLDDIETEDTAGTESAEPEMETAGAALSHEAQAAIDLANARAEETSMQLARVRKQLDIAAYEAERDTLARVHGIPPRITDLARTLLEGEGRTVDLANGKSADAGAIVRKLLTEVGRTVKMLDLSVELGTSEDGGDDAAAKAEQEAAERRELVASVRSMTGI